MLSEVVLRHLADPTELVALWSGPILDHRGHPYRPGGHLRGAFILALILPAMAVVCGITSPYPWLSSLAVYLIPVYMLAVPIVVIRRLARSWPTPVALLTTRELIVVFDQKPDPYMPESAAIFRAPLKGLTVLEQSPRQAPPAYWVGVESPLLGPTFNEFGPIPSPFVREHQRKDSPCFQPRPMEGTVDWGPLAPVALDREAFWEAVQAQVQLALENTSEEEAKPGPHEGLMRRLAASQAPPR